MLDRLDLAEIKQTINLKIKIKWQQRKRQV